MKSQSLSSNLFYYFGRKVIDAYTRFFLKWDLLKLADMPAGPKIIASNHPSTSDPFFIGKVVDEKIAILITKGAFDLPVFGTYLKQAGHICVPYYNSKFDGRPIYQQAQKVLSKGGNIAIFPEGGLSPEIDQPGVAKTGAVRLAMETGALIIPVGISVVASQVNEMTWNIKGQIEKPRWYFKGPYAVTTGQAIPFKGNIKNRALVKENSRKLMNEIRKLAVLSHKRLLAVS